MQRDENEKKQKQKKTKMKERKTEEIKILFLFAREICACLPYGLSARMLHGFRRDLLRAPNHPLSRTLLLTASTPPGGSGNYKEATTAGAAI